MDRQAYILHARQKLIQESIDMINSWPEEEILGRMQACPECFSVEATSNDVEHAIIEGITPEDVDKILGVDSHCEDADPEDSEMDEDVGSDDDEDDDVAINITDTGAELKLDIPEDEVEEDVASEFRSAIDSLCDQGDVAFMVAYVYADGDDMSKARNLRGRTFVFGSRPILDTMLTQLSQRMDDSMGDDGIVMDLDGASD